MASSTLDEPRSASPKPSFNASTHQRCQRWPWRRRVPKSESLRFGSFCSRSSSRCCELRGLSAALAAVMAAAVADWQVLNARDSKIKKDAQGAAPMLEFAENPDILAWLGRLTNGRPDLVVGFAAQLLIGVMSYLLPTTMGGGPGAVRAGLQELDRWGLLRATFVNGGLLIWMGTDISVLKVVASLLCIGSLAVYPIFIARAVKAQKQVLMKKAEGPEPKTTADWNQIYIGIAILAVIYALFAAL